MSRLPRLLLVTRNPFWRLGDGQRTRTMAVVRAIAPRCEITVLFLGEALPGDPPLLQARGVPLAFHAMGGKSTPEKKLAAVRALCAGTPFDVCLIERVHLHYLRHALPPGVRAVLDTHDLISGHAESRRLAGLPSTDFGLDQEIELLRPFDRVLLIQADEFARVSDRLEGRALLVPHAVAFPRRPIVPGRRNLGFVGGPYEANFHALDWFADRVWPALAGTGAQVHLYGRIGEVWRTGAHGDFVRHGFVSDPDRVWSGFDVSVNPVRWGSGLKIKSVEALGNGLPLVTTSEGAAGLADGAHRAFVLADAPEAFTQACARLLADPAERARLGAAAYAYARERFSPQACFGALLDWLAGCVPADA